MLESSGVRQIKCDEEFEDIVNHSTTKVKGEWESTRETLAERGPPPPFHQHAPGCLLSVRSVFIHSSYGLSLRRQWGVPPAHRHLHTPPTSPVLLYRTGSPSSPGKRDSHTLQWAREMSDKLTPLYSAPQKKNLRGKNHGLRDITHVFIMFCWQ